MFYGLFPKVSYGFFFSPRVLLGLSAFFRQLGVFWRSGPACAPSGPGHYELGERQKAIDCWKVRMVGEGRRKDGEDKQIF